MMDISEDSFDYANRSSVSHYPLQRCPAIKLGNKKPPCFSAAFPNAEVTPQANNHNVDRPPSFLVTIWL